MTPRGRRLMGPAAILWISGLVVLVAGEEPWARLKGGLVVTAAYVFVIAVVSAVLWLMAYDDRRSRAKAVPGPTRRGNALLGYYRSVPVPALLFSFGVTSLLSTAVIGCTPLSTHPPVPWHGAAIQQSEIALGAVLAPVAIASAVVSSVRAHVGWMLGYCSAVAATQWRFVSDTDLETTLLSWGGTAVALAGAGAVAISLRRLARGVRNKEVPTAAT